MPAANAIRQLRAGERPPPGNPVGAYRNADGYTRLRWQVGPRRYVEAYEHRQVARPAPGQLVHHHGGRSDNARKMLVNVSPAQHARLEHQGGPVQSGHSMRPGGGGRFAALEHKLEGRPGVHSPGGLAATIGREKYGAGRFQGMAAAARHLRHRGRTRHGRHPGAAQGSAAV